MKSNKMTKNYGQYQQSLYANGMLSGTRSVITPDPRHLEEQARKAMSLQSFNYIAGGAGEKASYTGTGGTDLVPFLKQTREETEEAAR